MSVEGALRIEVDLHGDTLAAVKIASSRPVGASRLFHGMTPDATLALMPRLFSVCGTAQGCAAATAIEQAQGLTTTADDIARRRLLLLMETAQEHLWRLCVDGAALAGRAPLLPTAAAGRRLLPRLTRALFPRGNWRSDGQPFDAREVEAVAEELEALLTAEILGQAPAAWIARLHDTDRWWSEGEQLAAHLLQALEHGEGLDLGAREPAFLPALDAQWLERNFTAPEADRFIAAPTLDGASRETTPLARQWSDPALQRTVARFGSGLAARVTALLLELAKTPLALRLVAEHPDDGFDPKGASLDRGIGLAQLEAARGRLVHRVQLNGEGKVARYQILAPTEWNFHPQGLLPRALVGQRVADAAAAQRMAELMVQAIDPCVGFEVTVHA